MQRLCINISNISVVKDNNNNIKVSIDAIIKFEDKDTFVAKYSDNTLAFTLYKGYTKLPEISRDASVHINNTLKAYAAGIKGDMNLVTWLDNSCISNNCKLELE